LTLASNQIVKVRLANSQQNKAGQSQGARSHFQPGQFLFPYSTRICRTRPEQVETAAGPSENPNSSNFQKLHPARGNLSFGSIFTILR
jgi:hypothetical protein